jgi:serine phosphatase RsbU (regulator of sigma subunit)
MAGSTPLGLVATAGYTQNQVQMRNGDRALLLTDGIPEARDGKGVLFGFSRVETLLHDGATAHGVADMAQQYGQNDDITAICIARQS